MENAKISNLYDLNETIAAKLFDGATYPWELLPKISAYIVELGNSLDPEIYEKKGENIWKKWINFYNKSGIAAITTDANLGKGIKETLKQIEKVMEEDMQKAASKRKSDIVHL